jgi:hypothetical protein
MASSGEVSFYNKYNTVTFFEAFKPSQEATYQGVKYVGLIASAYLVALVDTVARTLFTVFIAPVAAIYFAATHNEANIHKLLELKGKASPSICINFAQFFGLADHLTYMLKERRENVYKLLPWAQTQVMVGYMIRRAEELSQMNYPLEIQHFLLMNELRIKTIGM